MFCRLKSTIPAIKSLVNSSKFPGSYLIIFDRLHSNIPNQGLVNMKSGSSSELTKSTLNLFESSEYLMDDSASSSEPKEISPTFKYNYELSSRKKGYNTHNGNFSWFDNATAAWRFGGDFQKYCFEHKDCKAKRTTNNREIFQVPFELRGVDGADFLREAAKIFKDFHELDLRVKPVTELFKIWIRFVELLEDYGATSSEHVAWVKHETSQKDFIDAATRDQESWNKEIEKEDEKHDAKEKGTQEGPQKAIADKKL